jgi:hypothetical protein
MPLRSPWRHGSSLWNHRGPWRVYPGAVAAFREPWCMEGFPVTVEGLSRDMKALPGAIEAHPEAIKAHQEAMEVQPETIMSPPGATVTHLGARETDFGTNFSIVVLMKFYASPDTLTWGAMKLTPEQ